MVVCYLWREAKPSVTDRELERYQINWTLEPILSSCDSELAIIQTNILGVDISGVDILAVDILGFDILGLTSDNGGQVLKQWQQLVLILLWR